jgi:hypothetical protein
VNAKTKASPLFYLLAVITLALSSWGYFHLLTHYAATPPALAVVAIGALDIAAVLFGKHALTVAEDGDSSAPWNLALLALVGVGSFAQYADAALSAWPLAVGVILAALPIVTVLLFEGQLRRAYRLRGRAAGRLAPPRATFDLIVWIFFPRQALQAMKMAVLDRGLDSDTALMLAERELERQRELAARKPERRRFQRSYAHLLKPGERGELEAGPVIDADDQPDSPDDRVPSVRTRGVISAAVRAARDEHGDDLDKVLTAVRMTAPDADRDTVRRTLSRLNGRTG